MLSSVVMEPEFTIVHILYFLPISMSNLWYIYCNWLGPSKITISFIHNFYELGRFCFTKLPCSFNKLWVIAKIIYKSLCFGNLENWELLLFHSIGHLLISLLLLLSLLYLLQINSHTSTWVKLLSALCLGSKIT